MQALPALGGEHFAFERKLRYFGSFDYFLPANSGNGLKNQLKKESDALIAKGYDSLNYSVNTNGGAGTRVGVLYPVDAKTEMGGSFGYVIGPTMNSNLTATSIALGNGGETINRSVIFIRILAELKVNFPLSSHWSLALGTGGGLAVGRLDRSCDDSGSVACSGGATRRSWTGFAWEFSPAIAYRRKIAEVSCGIRYAGFPRFAGDDQLAPISWTTLGFYLGASF